MLPNNMVIVPNNKPSQRVLTNYHLPVRQMVLQVPVRVSYASDPEVVEQVLLEEAHQAFSRSIRHPGKCQIPVAFPWVAGYYMP